MYTCRKIGKMVNPVFALSGLGMILVGIVPILWWRYRTLVPWKNFWLGSLLWIIAITIKVLMDISITPVLVSHLQGIYTGLGIAIITGAYQYQAALLVNSPQNTPDFFSHSFASVLHKHTCRQVNAGTLLVHIPHLVSSYNFHYTILKLPAI